jgi:hypothetical protein
MSPVHELSGLLLSRPDPVLDKRHRVKFGGSLNYEFKNFKQFLPPMSPKVISGLKDDCLKAFSYRASSEEDEDETGSVHSTDYHNDGCTFFLRSNDTPRCALEELARRVFLLHTGTAEFDPATSGAEWWTQVVDSNSDIGFHWDKDYAYEQTTGINLFPHLGTVTYLTDTGGPTVVLRRPGCPMSADDHSGLVSDIVISHPEFGKHMKFDGQMLHAAPAGLCSSLQNQGTATSPTKRVTFLVNIWLNHIPIRTMPFPNELVGATTSIRTVFPPTAKGAVPASSGTIVKCPQLPLIAFDKKTRQPLALDLHSWKFNNGNMKYIVYVPLPDSDRLRELSKQGNAYSFVYKGSGVESRIELQENIEICSGGKGKKSDKRKRADLKTGGEGAAVTAVATPPDEDEEDKEQRSNAEDFEDDIFERMMGPSKLRCKARWRVVHKSCQYTF